MTVKRQDCIHFCFFVIHFDAVTLLGWDRAIAVLGTTMNMQYTEQCQY